MAVTKTEAIKNFLTARSWPDLAEMYNSGMECQVNVHNKAGGERIHGDWQGKRWFGYGNDHETWKPFRIPWNASTEPKYKDANISWDFETHVDSIGMTGWDWENKCSRWVAFDFDSVIGHSDSHTKNLTQIELAAIQERATTLPYVSVRKSTSGTGLHLYVQLEPTVPTQNHNEHAALGRAILAQMGFDAKFEFSNKVDVAGGNMWVWHTKMEPREKTGGLELVHQGSPMTNPPKNWKAHLDVVRNKRQKAIVSEYEDETQQSTFERIAEQRTHMKLDDEHITLIKHLEDDGEWESYYNPEIQCLVTHTKALEKAHEKFEYKGAFKTSSSGSTRKNCFCFPCPKGGWIVLRFNQASEHPTWETDSNGWTKSYYNMLPTIRSASTLFGGSEDAKGGWNFPSLSDAARALKIIGVNGIEKPEILEKRRSKISTLQDGRLLLTVDSKGVPEHIEAPNGWNIEKV